MRTTRNALSISDFRYSPLVAALALAFVAQPAEAFTVKVTTGSDLVPTVGSLRAAIEYFNIASNCGGGGDRIEFDFSANGPFTVMASAPLPMIQCGGLTIDGTGGGVLQGNFAIPAGFSGSATASPRPTIQNMEVFGFSYGTALAGNLNADGNNIHDNNVGIETSGDSQIIGNTVSGNNQGIRVFGNGTLVNDNQVHSNSATGIVVQTGAASITNNTVYNNGVTGIQVAYGGSTVLVDGNAVFGQRDVLFGQSVGILLLASNSVVSNNTIDDNDMGIALDFDGGSKIASNKIGTNSSGDFSEVGNTYGILFRNGSHNDTVIEDNVISGNADAAIDVWMASGVTIANNNRIGVNAAADATIANGYGVIVQCSTDVVVKGNVITGNLSHGIWFGAVQGGGRVEIDDNKIGVMGDGVTAYGNSAYGVLLGDSFCGETVTSAPAAKRASAKAAISGGSSGIQVRGNTISGNAAGVFVTSGVNNEIVENLIYDNGSTRNLNLNYFGGVLPNDADLSDNDTGPNNWQNWPSITTSPAPTRNFATGKTTINYTLQGPDGTYRIDVYSNGSDSTPGSRIKHGNTSLTIAGGAGAATGSFAVPSLSANNFSLTATDLAGNTSEYSPTVLVASEPNVSFVPGALNFGNVAVGSTSSPGSVAVNSTGTAPYVIVSMALGSCTDGSPFSYGGPFMISTNCNSDTDMNPGTSCSFSVRFAPIALGTYTRNIAICDNTNYEGTRRIALTGTAVPPPPVSISPTQEDFGDVLVGVRTAPHPFTITNPGNAEVTIGNLTTTGDFRVETTDCAATMAPKSDCTVTVSFAPTAPGRLTGQLSVLGGVILSEGAASKARRKVEGSATAGLVGTGIVSAGLQLPSAIEFGTYTLGTAPLRRTVQIRNDGNAVLTFSNVSVEGPFALSNGCPENLAPGESCAIALDFSTGVLGDFRGALTVVTNAAGGSRTIALSARSVPVPAPLITVSPSTMGFGERLLGTTSASQRVTVRNIGNAEALIALLVSPEIGPDFAITSTTCGITLAPQTTCFAEVVLKPAGFGRRSGQFLVNSNSVGSPHAVNLGGTGCRPWSSTAARIGFGSGSGFSCAP